MRSNTPVASAEGFTRLERVLGVLALIMAILAGAAHVRFGGAGAAASSGPGGAHPVLEVHASSAVVVARDAGLTRITGLGNPGRQAKPFTWLAEAMTAR